MRAPRCTSSSASARKRCAVTRTGTSSGSGACSSPRTLGSSTIWPALTSGIDALPEWLDAGPLHRVDEQLVGTLAKLDIGGGNVLHDVRNLRVRNRGSDQRAELGALVGLAAERDLIKLLAVLLDAENADMADMVMAAGIDAAGDIDVQAAEIARQVEVAEAPRDLLGDRDRARVGKTAIIQAGTGDDIGDKPDIRR